MIVFLLIVSFFVNLERSKKKQTFFKLLGHFPRFGDAIVEVLQIFYYFSYVSGARECLKKITSEESYTVV